MTKEEAVETIVKDYNDGLVCICGGLWKEERIKETKAAFKALEQEPATKNDCAEQNGCITCSLDDGDDCCRKLYEKSMQELLRLNLRVDCISRQAVVDMTGLSEWFDSSDSYNEFVIALSELPSVTPQEPKTGYISLDDAMSVFDDFMHGDADEEDAETFLEMLKDKAGSEG